jgi:hypothetical protein
MMTSHDLVLSGIVEMDEIYAGAPPRKKHGGGPTGVKSGRSPRRPLILTIAERGGDVVFRQIPTHSTMEIRDASENIIDASAIISTDSLPAYRKAVSRHTHLTVNHSAGASEIKIPYNEELDQFVGFATFVRVPLDWMWGNGAATEHVITR